MNPDFIRTVDFFTRESPTRNTEKKNIFRENPVEVRSFDGTFLNIYFILVRFVRLFPTYVLCTVLE